MDFSVDPILPSQKAEQQPLHHKLILVCIMKLASVEIIEQLHPIEGADKIELATVLGWDVIVLKGSYQIGDRCIFIPIDTVADLTKPWFGMLKDTRIKTIRLRGVYSQGLTVHPNQVDFELPTEIGTDVADSTGVSKYEKDTNIAIEGPRHNRQSLFTSFPTSIISKTDEDNLRSRKQCLEELRGRSIYISKKMDGCSMTLIWKQGQFTLCSRNIVLYQTSDDNEVKINVDGTMVNFALEQNWHQRFKDANIAIQGEFCGPGLNGNRMKLADLSFYVFNIKDLDGRRYFSMEELQIFTNKEGFKMVPIMHTLECTPEHDIKFFQDMANAVRYGSKDGEGIVVRPITPFYSPILEKTFSFKVLNQKYKD
jgi:RNA ligase (TIGR02306 family)